MGVGLGARVVVVGVRIVVGRGAPGLVGGEPRHCVDVVVELGRMRVCCKVGGSIGRKIEVVGVRCVSLERILRCMANGEAGEAGTR